MDMVAHSIKKLSTYFLGILIVRFICDFPLKSRQGMIILFVIPYIPINYKVHKLSGGTYGVSLGCLVYQQFQLQR